MKGIRYSTEQKIRILREAESSGKQLKELQSVNARLKRMLVDEIFEGNGSVFYRVVEQ